MPLNCSSLAMRVPHVLGNGRLIINKFTSNHVGTFFFSHHHNSSKHILSLSNFNQSCSSTSSVMEDQKKLCSTPSEPEKYSKELEVAVRAVQMACALCQRVQDSLISKTNGQVQSKDDNSPVTVAGNSSSSSYFFFIICSQLGSCYWCWLSIVMYFGCLCL
jgi:3'(2'), 5'-bisphosphate nucleotidase